MFIPCSLALKSRPVSNVFHLLFFFTGGTADSKMEVKTSLLDNMIGVGDMVLLEPLNEDSFIVNLRNRFDHNEIYVSSPSASIKLGLAIAELYNLIYSQCI